MVDAERLEFQPSRLLEAVEQRARALVGADASPEDLKETMERATICIDEIDKMSSIVAGKPNPIGVVLQQELLTLMEGEIVVCHTHFDRVSIQQACERSALRPPACCPRLCYLP